MVYELWLVASTVWNCWVVFGVLVRCGLGDRDMGEVKGLGFTVVK
jgi:hypothetical protein